MIDQVPEKLNIASIYKFNSSLSKLEFYISSLCSSIQTPRPAEETDIAMIGNKIELLPIHDPQTAEKRLLELLDIAEEAKNRPLPLFPHASFAFATSKKKKKEAACNAFSGDLYTKGDLQTMPLLKHFFSPENFDTPAFFQEFEKLARIVYAPWFNEEKTESDEI